MEKEFVCTIDQAKFNSEHALIKHLLSYYSMTQKPGEKSSDVLKLLQDAFPTASIEVTNSQHNKKDTPYINIFIADCGASFDFRLASEGYNEDFYGETVYKTVEDAIDNYKEMLAEKDKLVDAVKEKFSAESVEIHQIHQSSDYGDDSNSITFSFFINGKEYGGNYEFEGIDKCLRSLEGYFVKIVEGDCYTDYGKYNSSNTIYVDGVDLRDIAFRAKKLKVEIIEFK